MKKLIITISIISISLFSFLVIKQNKEEPIKLDSPKKQEILSMMLEQNAGTGDYKMVSQSTWPSEGYIFNSELSRCENGSTLTWDDDKKQVIFSGNVSDKCYVYFDIYKTVLLKDYVILQYTGVEEENGIYYHYNFASDNTFGAGDDSFRYYGPNPNNFVCFGSDASTCPNDNLYRIIGVIDGKVKLIKADYANSNLLGTDGDYEGPPSTPGANYKGKFTMLDYYLWNKSETNIWSESNLNKINLNTNYINNIGALWANKIETTTWKVGINNSRENIISVNALEAYKNEISNPVESTTYNAKIGLMYVSDYMFAVPQDKWTLVGYDKDNDATKDYQAATNVNWMYMGDNEWTISSFSDVYAGAFIASNVGAVSFNFVFANLVARPVFFLKENVTYTSGTGTESDPIRIN